MKKLLLTCLGLLSLGLTASASTTWTWASTSKTWSAAGVQTLTDADTEETANWDLQVTWADDSKTYFGNDGTKGQQVGSSKNYATAFTLTSSSFENKIIEEVVVNTSCASSANATVTVTVNGVQYGDAKTTNATATDYSFIPTTPQAGEIVISWTCNTTGKAYYFNKISVTYNDGSSITVAKPQFDPVAGTYHEAQNVEITCSTAGATLEYSLDNENWQAYTDKVPVTESCILYARATLDNVTSTNSAEYVIKSIQTATSIADIYSKVGKPASGSTDEFLLDFDLVVTAARNNNLYVADGQGGYALFYLYGYTATAGQIIKGGYTAVITYYNGTYEICPKETPDAAVDGGTIPAPVVLTVAQLTGDYQCYYAQLKQVQFTEATPDSRSNFTGTCEDTEVTFYNNFTLDAEEAGWYNVTGIVSYYNNGSSTNVQFYPTAYEATDAPVVSQCADPVFTPGSGDVASGTVVTVSCKTEGATFVYTIDDGEVLTADFPFTYTVTQDVVIEGYATKTGLDDSNVVTAAYTVVTAVSDVFVSASCTDVEGVTITNQDPTADLPSSGGSSATLNCVGKTFEGSTCDLQFQYVNGGSYSCVFADGLRWYKSQTFTVTPHTGYTILGIELNTTAQSYVQSITVNLYDSTTEQYVAASEACVLDKEKNMITWAGEVAKNQAIQAVASAQIRLNYIKVTTTDGSNGVSDIIVDGNANAPVEYYNLQGLRVTNPTAGQLLIRRQGSNVSKILY
ncbi:MAG: hypothetical protein LUC85_06960 [Bacteroidales bacterium]|nr:hypothetical protein [Bacteroidales bacterium]MCD8394559.1 hypothetical protein [Bacteroidales bacterium]